VTLAHAAAAASPALLQPLPTASFPFNPQRTQFTAGCTPVPLPPPSPNKLPLPPAAFNRKRAQPTARHTRHC
jgi:hypothetical protein